MRRLVLALAASLSLLTISADEVRAEPPVLPEKPLDLELEQVDVREVFRLLAEVGQRKIAIDTCVHGNVDLSLRNAPLPVVFDVLAHKLGLRYHERADAIVVSCLPPDATAARDPRLEARVTVNVREAPLRTVLSQVAEQTGIANVDYRFSAGDKRFVTVTLVHVRLGTLLAVLADEAGALVTLERDSIVATHQ